MLRPDAAPCGATLAPFAGVWDEVTTQGRVLVADDHEHMRSLLHECFQNAGYAVDSVEDGEAALAHLTSEKPDVLILSLIGRGVDADAVVERLRASGDATPVVVLTADPGDSNYRPAPAGVAATLSRPFTFPMLLGVCEALTAREIA